MVAAVATATGQQPESVGKPAPAMFEQAAAGAGAQRPLVVGDRLDTDIAGAVRAGMPSLVVLSGVSAPVDLLAAPPEERPTYLGRDLDALTCAPLTAVVDHGASRAECRGVVVEASGDVQRPRDDIEGLDVPIAGLTAACALAWAGHLERALYETVLSRLDLG